MKVNSFCWTVISVVFLFTYYVKSDLHIYPSIPFPDFGSEWKTGNIKPASISFFSTTYQREISITEIIHPHEGRISFFATQLLNREETQTATVTFIQNVWLEKYPDDTLIAKVRE